MLSPTPIMAGPRLDTLLTEGKVISPGFPQSFRIERTLVQFWKISSEWFPLFKSLSNLFNQFGLWIDNFSGRFLKLYQRVPNWLRYTVHGWTELLGLLMWWLHINYHSEPGTESLQTRLTFRRDWPSWKLKYSN